MSRKWVRRDNAWVLDLPDGGVIVERLPGGTWMCEVWLGSNQAHYYDKYPSRNKAKQSGEAWARQK